MMRTQPQGIWRPDSGNPIARGLRAWITPGMYLPREQNSALSKVVPVVGYDGQPQLAYSNIANGNGGGSIFFPIPFVDSSEWTYAVICSAINRNGYDAIADFNDYDTSRGTSSAGWRFSIETSVYGSQTIGTDNRYYASDNNSGVQFPFNGTQHLLMFTVSGKTGLLTTYLDGVQISQSAISNAGVVGRLNNIQLFGKARDGDPSAGGSTVSLAALWDRSLSADEARRFYPNPWQIAAAPDTGEDYALVAADTVLAANVTVTASVFGALTTAIPLSSATSAQASGTAALSTVLPLSTSATVQTTMGGALTTATPLSSVAGAQTSTAGALSTAIPLATVAAAQASASGTLTTQVRMAAAVAAQASASGALSSAIPLSAAVGAQATMTGMLAGAGVALSASMTAAAGASAALSTAIPLSATAGAQTSMAGALAGAGASLSANMTAGAVAGAALSTAIPLSAAAVVQASGTGALLTTIRLVGSFEAAATLAGSLAGTGAVLSAAMSASAGSVSALSTAITLAAAPTARASAGASLMTYVRLTSAFQAQASFAGTLDAALLNVDPTRVLRLAAENRILRLSAENRIQGAN